MKPFEETPSYPVFLAATLPSSLDKYRFHLVLRDNQGHHGVAEVNLAQAPPLPDGTSWDAFHASFVRLGTGETDHKAFGQGLFRLLLQDDPRMREAWAGIRAATGGRSLSLIVTFGKESEQFARLPLELLHDDSGFLFARPGSALRRTFETTRPQAFAYPPEPRLLLAWVCPPGAGDVFDPAPHEAALRAIFGQRLRVCPRACPRDVETALATAAVSTRWKRRAWPTCSRAGESSWSFCAPARPRSRRNRRFRAWASSCWRSPAATFPWW